MEERELGTVVRPVQGEDSVASHNSDGVIFAEVCERVYGSPIMPWQKEFLAALWDKCFVRQEKLYVNIPRKSAKSLCYPLVAAAMVLDKMKERENNA